MFLGIFDFIAELLVGISTGMLNIIDLIMTAVNRISGVEDISVSGKQTDFITYLIRNDKVAFAFAIASLCGIILIVLFSVIQIIITFTKDKVEETPAMVAKKAAKNLLLLLLVPTFMYAFILLTNAFVRALYEGTQIGGTTLGEFMFRIFAEDAVEKGAPFSSDVNLSYHASFGKMWEYLDLWDYHFFYSYLIGGLVIYALMSTCLMLVERAISIVFLYIISPFVVASSVLDDGGKFKSWRDQILIKFLSGHGAIIAINIYMLVVGLVITSEVEFFSDWFVNTFVKLVFITGGAFMLKSVQALIGNIIQVGAGDKAMAETSAAAGKVGRALTSPLRGARSLFNYGKDMSQYGSRDEKGNLNKTSAFFSTLGNRLGFKTDRDYGKWSKAASEDRDHQSSKANKNRPDNPVQAAIEGPNQNNQGGNNNQSNANNNKAPSAGQNMVQNAIAQKNDK